MQCPGQKNTLITAHEGYTALAKTEKTRLARYTELSKTGVSEEIRTEIQDAWQTGTPLGSDKFKNMIERKLNIKVGHARRGRPRKNPA